MTAILFAPHQDDETLFAFVQLLRHRPHVVFVLRSFKEAGQGGPSYKVREREAKRAMEIAGCEWEQWEYPDTAPDWRAIAARIGQTAVEYDLVIAPAWEAGGHDDHNMVGVIANAAVRGPGLIEYLTYRRGEGRSMNDNEVEATGKEKELKRQALACYESQATYPPTAPWFNPNEYGDLREWTL